MMTDEAWMKLIRGLRNATAHGTMQWTEKDHKYNDGPRSLASLPDISRPKIFLAMKASAMYEISGADGFGRAPFEFSLWRIVEKRLESVGTVSSSARVTGPMSIQLNGALEELFRTVDQNTESGDDLVERLLREIGE